MRLRQPGLPHRRHRPEINPSERHVVQRLQRGANGVGNVVAHEQLGVEEQVLQVVHRDGILQHARAARDPSQHHGEPRVVHSVYSLPGRDISGPSRVPHEFPNHDLRSHRASNVQRFLARRRNCGR